MDLLALAQRDTGSWIDTVVTFLIIGGLILGPLSKKLIEAFSPKKTDERKAGGGGPEKVTPARPARPVTPPARPAAPAAAPARPSWVPAERSVSGPPVARRAEVAEPLGPVVPPPRAPVSAPAGKPAPVPRPPAQSASRTVRDQRGRIELGLSHLAPADLGHLEPKEHLGHLAPEEHLGHLVPQPGTPATGRKRHRRLTHATTSARAALRHAIIMSEVLGPPLALRQANDPLQGR